MSDTNTLLAQFQKNPSNKELESQLLEIHKPYIQANINKWKGGAISDPVLDAYGHKFAVDAFKTYDSSKANINTHLYNHISQLSRMVYKAQNTVRIPESQLQMIGKVNQATDYLNDQLDRKPTVDEIADFMHLPKGHIAKVITNQRADFISDSDSERQHAYGDTDTDTSNRIFSYRQSLDPERQKYFDSLTGFGGAKVMSPKQFGKKFKFKTYEVSRLKNYFAKGIK